MKLKILVGALLLGFLFGTGWQSAAAQSFPAGLLNEIPEAAAILNSPDARERAAILKKLVVPVSRSCSFEQSLPFKLGREDYDFVVGKILELDLSALDYRENAYVWGNLGHLIIEFKLVERLETLSKYLDHPELNVRYGIIYAIERLNARGLDAKVALFLESPDLYSRRLSLETLISLQSKRAVPALVKQLADPDYLQRHAALMSLVKVNGLAAAPHVAAILNDEHPDNRHWAIDTLVRLGARSETAKLWKYLETETDERRRALAMIALLALDDKKAVPPVLKTFKDCAAKGGNLYIFEFIQEFKPKLLIPEMLALYYQKERFFAEDEFERQMRLNIYNLLYDYRIREAIPIYRETLFVDIFDRKTRQFNEGVAQILVGLGATEAVDDLIVGLTDELKNKNDSYYHYKVGVIAYYLAKLGDKKAHKLLIDVAAANDSHYRGLIIAELNKQLDPELWKKLDAAIMPMVGIEPIADFAEKATGRSGVKIVFEKNETSGKASCRSDDITLTDAIPCAYSDGRMSVLTSIYDMFSDRRNRNYTWIFDAGKVRILPVEKAVEWWRSKILTN